MDVEIMCDGEAQFFFWLLLRDRLNTRELLKRKNMELDDYNCVLCRQGIEECLWYLFFECPFSKWCWRLIKVCWNTSLPPHLMLIRSSRQFNSKIFIEVIMIADWTIWCHRNAVIFDGWKFSFKEELSPIIHRAKPSMKSLINS
jgi:hypothetical protein